MPHFWVRIEVAIFCAFALASTSSSALEFSRQFDTDPVVYMTGEIRPGDTERFAQFLRTQKHFPGTLELDSPGGFCP